MNKETLSKRSRENLAKKKAVKKAAKKKPVKKIKSLEEMQAEIDKLEATRQELFKKKAPIDAQLTRGYNRIKKLQESISTIVVADKTKGKIDWEWTLHEDGHSSDMVRHNYFCKCIEDLGLYGGGYFPETKQHIVQVMLKKDKKSIAKTIKALNLLLPFIKPLKNGYKYIDIFEYTCSENGVWFMHIDEKNSKFHIMKTTYSNTETKKKFDNLPDIIAHIHRFLPYEKDEGDNFGCD